MNKSNKFTEQFLCHVGPEKNVAIAEFGAKTISGMSPLALLDGNATGYDGFKGKLITSAHERIIHHNISIIQALRITK